MQQGRLKKNAVIEIAAVSRDRGPSAEQRARDFFLTSGFRSLDMVRLRLETVSKMCIYTKSRRAAARVKSRFDTVRPKEFSLQIRVLGAADWLDKWKKDYRIMPLGKCFTLVPWWQRKKYHPVGSRIPIYLDPGHSFGTGCHETTKLAICLLERFNGKCESVFDVGFGTGILSVAAFRLGAKDVCGVDKDPGAIGVARDNIRINRCPEARFVRCDIGSCERGKRFDLVVANLLTVVLTENKALLVSSVKRGGALIVSGIARENLGEFRRGFESKELRCQRLLKGRMWCALLYRKRLG